VIETIDALDTGALFSPCRRWRYVLWRHWDRRLPICVFIGLNPSTADETQDDPTVRRCIRFAKDWGYGALWMLNAYAFRATDPAVMKAAGPNALGPRNNEYLRVAAVNADLVVAAWGTHCDEIREATVKQIVTDTGATLYCLGVTTAGHPKHPLYLRHDTPLQVWAAPDGIARR
jgi:hypothetical protein